MNTCIRKSKFWKDRLSPIKVKCAKFLLTGLKNTSPLMDGCSWHKLVEGGFPHETESSSKAHLPQVLDPEKRMIYDISNLES